MPPQLTPNSAILRPGGDGPFADEADAIGAWQALIDAGQIGVRLLADPAIAANRAQTEAIFRAARLYRERQS